MFMLVSCVGEYNTIRYDTLGVTQDYYHGEWRTLNSSNVSSSVAFDRPRRGSSCRTLQKEEQRKYTLCATMSCRPGSLDQPTNVTNVTLYTRCSQQG